MAKISDLEFKPHPTGNGVRAVVEFANGYSVSIVSGPLFYSTEDAPFEIAVMHGGSLVYDTTVTDDVLGYLTEREADDALQSIAELPPRD